MREYNLEQITPTIGAEISNIDLSQDLSEEKLDQIYQDLIDYKVIFFRNQQISPTNHIALAKSFGEIEPPHPVYPHVKDFPEIVLLENDANNPPDTDEWHTDVTFKSDPAFASILYSKIIPPSGGDTLWCSLSAIYEALPSDTKKYLETLRAVHDMGSFRNNFIDDDNEKSAQNVNEGFQKFGNAIHPMVKVHPISKNKLLYINPGFTSQIVGMNMTDSNNLLTYLFNFMNKPEFQIRFKWSANTIAIWDNRCTMHYAIGDYMPHHRQMNRITVLNDKRDDKVT
ncbi:taurine dioxygenase [Pelagibacteraceae bacterium]|nr:taurine dioxygenase [Pelagibacteraceae bacterium]